MVENPSKLFPENFPSFIAWLLLCITAGPKHRSVQVMNHPSFPPRPCISPCLPLPPSRFLSCALSALSAHALPPPASVRPSVKLRSAVRWSGRVRPSFPRRISHRWARNVKTSPFSNRPRVSSRHGERGFLSSAVGP